MAAEVTDEATGVAPVAAGDGCVKGEVGNVVITLGTRRIGRPPRVRPSLPCCNLGSLNLILVEVVHGMVFGHGLIAIQ